MQRAGKGILLVKRSSWEESDADQCQEVVAHRAVLKKQHLEELKERAGRT